MFGLARAQRAAGDPYARSVGEEALASMGPAPGDLLDQRFRQEIIAWLAEPDE